MADPIMLTVERHIDAPPEQVFDAWLDGDAVGKWLFATPDGVMERVELDPRVGGKFRVEERRGEGLAKHWGEYVEIDRPRRLVFDFRTSEDEAPTRVTVSIAAEGGGSRITLSHALAPEWADYEDRTRQGWTMILDGLARTLTA